MTPQSTDRGILIIKEISIFEEENRTFKFSIFCFSVHWCDLIVLNIDDASCKTMFSLYPTQEEYWLYKQLKYDCSNL